jgi:hypothetical protein
MIVSGLELIVGLELNDDAAAGGFPPPNHTHS